MDGHVTKALALLERVAQHPLYPIGKVGSNRASTASLAPTLRLVGWAAQLRRNSTRNLDTEVCPAPHLQSRSLTLARCVFVVIGSSPFCVSQLSVCTRVPHDTDSLGCVAEAPVGGA